MAFKQEWQMERRTELTKEEKRRKVLDIKLRKEDLGKKVGDEGQKKWSHIKWADKVRKAVKAAGDVNRCLIPKVMDNLPRLI
jgi:hypothetical protein